jgi:hypothetical protein
MASGLIDVMKRASMEAVANAQMCDLRYGKVTSTNPLKVHITNLFTVPESMLVVPEHLTDYEIKVTTTGYGWETESKGGGSGESSFSSHNHGINETEQKLKVHGALKVGDKVALLRKQGGQSYFILDRILNE